MRIIHNSKADLIIVSFQVCRKIRVRNSQKFGTKHETDIKPYTQPDDFECGRFRTWLGPPRAGIDGSS